MLICILALSLVFTPYLSNAVVSAKSPHSFSCPCSTEAVGIAHTPLPAKKKSRRRKRITRVNVVPRKSARLQKQSGKKKALENEQAVARLEEERKRREREIEQARVEQQMLCRCIVEYVSSMEKKDSFTHYPLPEVINTSTCTCMMYTSRYSPHNL